MNAAPPPDKAALPAWARALRMRRVELGKSQERVALDSGILNQTTISELEGAKYEVGNLTTARTAGLARGLGWTLAEMEEALGLNFGLAGMDTPTTHPASSPSTPPTTQPVELPDELLEAVSLYGKRFPDLKEPKWQQFLASFRARGMEGETPEDWLDLYRNMARHGIQPEEKD